MDAPPDGNRIGGEDSPGGNWQPYDSSRHPRLQVTIRSMSGMTIYDSREAGSIIQAHVGMLSNLSETPPRHPTARQHCPCRMPESLL
jgi:hypothetical protein